MKKPYKVNKSLHINAIKAAFPHTLPILTGFLFLGMSYGFLLSSKGFSFLYPFFMSLFIFAGSLEFTLANILVLPFDPLQTLLLALIINARHIFYGISMLEKYKGIGKKKIYMIFSLCDETFSLNYSLDAPSGVDNGYFKLYISLFDHLYWIIGATLGGLFGAFVPLDIVGIDFAMTALFVVILLEQILGGKKNIPSAIIGVLFTVISLLLFGKEDFLIPAMIMIFGALSLLHSPLERLFDGEEGKR